METYKSITRFHNEVITKSMIAKGSGRFSHLLWRRIMVPLHWGPMRLSHCYDEPSFDKYYKLTLWKQFCLLINFVNFNPAVDV